MTTQTLIEPRLKRRNHGRGHSYMIDGKKVLGVTTVLNALPKDALTKWAAEMAANEAINHWDELAQLPPLERHSRILWAHRATVKKAALRGTQIHSLGDKLSRGEEVDVPPEHVGPVEAYARFLDKWDIHMLATEAPCGHTQFGYAGTLDSIATIGKLGGEPVMLDLKTGKGVYESTALQLKAYAEANLWQPDGPDSEEPMPSVAGLYVAHILPDDVRLLPVENDASLLLQFRYLIETTRWLADSKESPLIGAALSVEDYS